MKTKMVPKCKGSVSVAVPLAALQAPQAPFSLEFPFALCCGPVMDIMSSQVEILGKYGCITEGWRVIQILGC